jgi:hypothetical protein
MNEKEPKVSVDVLIYTAPVVHDTQGSISGHQKQNRTVAMVHERPRPEIWLGVPTIS